MNVFKKTARITLAIALAILPLSTQAASDSGTATATVVTPIAIADNQTLAFGKFSALTGGTVVISVAGVRSATGAVVLVSTGSTQTQGTFDVTGDANATYAITLPTTVNITSGGNTMAVATFLSNPSATGTLSAGGAETVNVGATLTVASAQAPGSYTGTYSVTVEYN